MLPDILVFHLKRFSYSRYLKNKLDTFVDFPIHNLELSKYVKKKDGHSFTYELFAISNHYGGLGGGHYTAFAKVNEDSGCSSCPLVQSSWTLSNYSMILYNTQKAYHHNYSMSVMSFQTLIFSELLSFLFAYCAVD
jgi:hypothetical protein